MKKEKYVLNLIEDQLGDSRGGTRIGYWTGKNYKAEDVRFPGTCDDKHDPEVKVYTSKKRAENAVQSLHKHFTFISDADIESLD